MDLLFMRKVFLVHSKYNLDCKELLGKFITRFLNNTENFSNRQNEIIETTNIIMKN